MVFKANAAVGVGVHNDCWIFPYKLDIFRKRYSIETQTTIKTQTAIETQMILYAGKLFYFFWIIKK